MLTLTRNSSIQSEGLVGEILVDGIVYKTIEQKWRGNTPFVSCIPAGVYELIPWNSRRYGHCFVAVNELLNVFFSKLSPNRTGKGRYKNIFFHRGNYPKNFEGCGGVGERYNPAHDMITNTTQTSRIVNNYIAKEGIQLLNIIYKD